MSSHKHTVGLIFVIFCMVLSNVAQANIPTSERNALIALYNATGGDSWKDSSNWKVGAAFNLPGTECTWFGVTCSAGDVNVTQLNMDFNTLVGAVPPEIGDLPFLEKASLNGNYLTSLPGALSSLTVLADLSLSKNKLVTLPAGVGDLLNLQSLSLEFNQLGSIPPELAKLDNLNYLSLKANPLMSIPAGVLKLKNLQTLNIENIQLSTVPAELGNLTSLQTLSLAGNSYTSVPPELGNLINLQVLRLSSSQLESVPAELSKLVKLKELYLNDAKLTSLPAELGSLGSLQLLRLSNNNLINIPIELGNLTGLQQLLLDGNKLKTVPPEIGKLSNLNSLNLQINSITSLPVEIGALNSLSYLNLSGNNLSSLPVSLAGLVNLTYLNVSANSLRRIPPEWGGLVNLKELWLVYNKIENLPAELGNLTKLNHLLLEGNKIAGEIPASFINLISLQPTDEMFEIPGLDLDFNGVYTSDSSLLTFLNSKHDIHYPGGFMATQTLDAEGVIVTKTAEKSADLSWDPVTYTDAGGYRIYVSILPDSGFILHRTITDKLSTSSHITGLSPCMVYYTKVHSFTNPHAFNLNEVESDGLMGGPVEFMTTKLEQCPPVILSGLGIGFFSIMEPGVIGGEITTLTAIDPDGDPISYSIIDGNSEGKFAIDPATGLVTLVGLLDYETTPAYILTLGVSDGKTTVETKIVILVGNDLFEFTKGAVASGSSGCSLRGKGDVDLTFLMLGVLAIYYWLHGKIVRVVKDKRLRY